MLRRMKPIGLLLVGLVSLSNTGCIVVGVDGWSWSCCGPTVWTSEVTERINLDTTGLTGLDVRTHNGRITFETQPAGSSESYVTVTKKGGGRTFAEAQAALDAIDVYVEPTGGGVQRLGWRWKGIRPSYWGGHVGFDIVGPADIRFEGQTHNGPVAISGVTGGVRVGTHNGSIEAKGVTGDVHVETHNGPVEISADRGKLHGETHNGRIVATFGGDDLTLMTHNGPIEADLRQCAALGGTMTTHNGSVTVVVGDATSTRLTARTHNGGIACDVPLSSGTYSKRMLTGALGRGEGSLDLTTHNGSVRIEKAAG